MICTTKSKLPSVLTFGKTKAFLRNFHKPQIIRPQRGNTRVCALTNLEPSMAAYKINIKRLKPGLGDMLMLTPALLGLREKFPNAEITLSVKSLYAGNQNSKFGILYECVRYLPYIDHLVDVDGNLNESKDIKRSYDYEVDISGQAGEIQFERPGTKPIERVDIFCKYLGVTPSNKVPFLHVPKEYIEKVLNLIKERYPLGSRKIVAISQNSNTENRNVPLETLRILSDKLRRKNDILPVVFSENKDKSWDIPGVVEFREELDSWDFLALLSLADVVISPDTGSLHAAGALGKRLIGLWGSTHPESRTTYYKASQSVWHRDTCNKCPCWYDVGNCKDKVCFKAINSDELLNLTTISLERKGLEQEFNILRPMTLTVFVEKGYWTGETEAPIYPSLKQWSRFIDFKIKEVDKEHVSLVSRKSLEEISRSDLTMFIKDNLSINGRNNWLGRIISAFHINKDVSYIVPDSGKKASGNPSINVYEELDECLLEDRDCVILRKSSKRGKVVKLNNVFLQIKS